jgi:hypothetical protein
MELVISLLIIKSTTNIWDRNNNSILTNFLIIVMLNKLVKLLKRLIKLLINKHKVKIRERLVFIIKIDWVKLIWWSHHHLKAIH